MDDRRICGRRPKLPPEAVGAVFAARASSVSVRQIARDLGVAPSTVRRYLNGQHKRRVA